LKASVEEGSSDGIWWKQIVSGLCQTDVFVNAQCQPIYRLEDTVSDQLKMTLFVHHHVDLEMIETKASSGRYKSLEELRADVLTVFHNMMLCFDGSFQFIINVVAIVSSASSVKLLQIVVKISRWMH